MSKLSTDLVGKIVMQDKEKAWNPNATFAYYGLEGAFCRVTAAWVSGGTVLILIVDEKGHAAEVYAKLFLMPGQIESAD